MASAIPPPSSSAVAAGGTTAHQPQPLAGPSTTPLPTVVTKSYRPYFTDTELVSLSEKQRGRLSMARVERGRQTACTFIEAVCERVGFPRRTTATAQMLYHRFHLYFPLKDFSHTEVSLACIYVSSKLHDTLKKPRDLILHSYAIRYPLLLAGRLNVDPQTVDQKTLEVDKRKVASLERLVLETICFNLGVGRPDVGELGIKVGKAMGVSKTFSQLTWRMTADVYRTIAPLQHTPSSLILGSMRATALLTLGYDSKNKTGSEVSMKDGQNGLVPEAEVIRDYLSRAGEWEERFGTSVDEVDSVVHHLLDMHIILLTIPLADPSVSTISPDSPKDSLGPALQGSSAIASQAMANSMSSSKDKEKEQTQTAFRLPPHWTPHALTQLKISLRESKPLTATPNVPTGIEPTKMDSVTGGDGEHGKEVAKSRNLAEIWGALSEGLGKNDATIRFLFE